MNFKEFEELILSKVKENIGEVADVLIHSVTKNNGLKLSGIIILKKDEHMSPTVYLEQFYDDYICGRGIDSIVSEILQIYAEQKGQVSFDLEKFKSFDRIKNQILYKLVNYDKNEELLKVVPHRKFLDLAVVYYVVITSNELGIGSILIRNEYMGFWNITEEDLYVLAHVNTPKQMPCEIKSMANMILELMNKKFVKDDECNQILGKLISEAINKEDDDNLLKMYVLTNHSRINGANAILYKDIIRNFSKLIGKDLYILPSSIHEVIIVPDAPKISASTLLKIVKDVNEHNVAEEEWLSDSIYFYKYASDKIELVD